MRPVEWVRVFGVPIVLGVLLGLAGGWLWWLWWGPAPDGKVYDTNQGPAWYPDPFDPGITRDFSGTGTYVVIAVGLGLLLGVAAGWIARHRALLGLAAVVLGSVAASVVMVVLGTAQSPDDPQDRVDDVKIGAELPGSLELTSAEVSLPDGFADLIRDDDGKWFLPTAHLVWPATALIGYLLLMLCLPREEPEQPTPVTTAPSDGSAPPPTE